MLNVENKKNYKKIIQKYCMHTPMYNAGAFQIIIYYGLTCVSTFKNSIKLIKIVSMAVHKK